GAALAATPLGAAAPMLGASAAHYRRVALGGFEVTTLLDGAAPFPEPQGIFGTDQSVADVEAALAAADLPTGAIEIGFAPTLVNTGAELVLFDTGNGAGAQPARGNLLSAMEAAGYSADQVDVVVITHMHPDHIGGMMTDGAPTFPNARYATGRVEYDFFASEDRIGSPVEGLHQMVTNLVAPMADRMSFLEPGQSVVSGIDAVNAFGHTPGHMAYHIESEGKRLMVTADAANHFVLSLEHPDWHVRFDADKAAAAATRRQLFGMLDADGVPFVGYHMPFPAMGFVTASGSGFRWTPATYQFSL
ncbi:MAG: MBL fold metallo-hydrolase, partial [Pseudomonadota bacterium]